MSSSINYIFLLILSRSGNLFVVLILSLCVLGSICSGLLCITVLLGELCYINVYVS